MNNNDLKPDQIESANDAFEDDALKKAYENDIDRKTIKDEELSAAKEYLSLLLKEAEGRNEELEGRTKELEGSRLKADELKERLEKTESEIQELKDENRKSEKQRGVLTLWVAFSIIEFVIILGVGVLFLFSRENIFKNFFKGEETSVEQEGNSFGALVGADNSEKVLTAKFCDDLSERVKYISHESIAPFSVSVENIDGMEYLVFSADSLKICYRNEYFLEDMAFRKSVLIEGKDRRFVLAKGYDLENDIVELCPRFTYFENVKSLVFTEYLNTESRGIPDVIHVVDCDNLRVYTCSNLKDKINSLMKVSFTADKSPEELLGVDAADATGLEEIIAPDGYPVLLDVTTSRAAYRYAITESDFNEITYNQYEIPQIESDFVMSVNENGIYFETNVMLGEAIYLGHLSGTLIPSGNALAINNAKFGAYAPANAEDPQFHGSIVALKDCPKRYLSINGRKGETFYIALNENIPACRYYMDNINTEEAYNWQYFDADGNLASFRGIDVSKFQGNIQWDKVAAEGVDFAIIRMGYRGMTEGTLEYDPYFKTNVSNAIKNGIKVGVYFFSQAKNEAEAVAEADFVINAIKDYNITYPVVYDTEYVSTYDARANNLSMEERTKACAAFCDRIAKAGYKPMIYANTKYMVMGIDLEQLTAYDKWFAVYSDKITFPYDFDILQYSETGRINGIEEYVDLDISFIDYSIK